jgi:hypothetical protein
VKKERAGTIATAVCLLNTPTTKRMKEKRNLHNLKQQKNHPSCSRWGPYHWLQTTWVQNTNQVGRQSEFLETLLWDLPGYVDHVCTRLFRQGGCLNRWSIRSLLANIKQCLVSGVVITSTSCGLTPPTRRSLEGGGFVFFLNLWLPTTRPNILRLDLQVPLCKTSGESKSISYVNSFVHVEHVIIH